ncbi:lipase family protein [Phnomibacter sp. MR]|uniref:lipase family protein n=1 Tax=Phnomibacter sp. MR TaxID=3042318 RepID=UPI003A8033A9
MLTPFRRYAFVMAVLLSCQPLLAQQLQPGFDRKEYADMLWLQFYGITDSMLQTPPVQLEKDSYRTLLISKEVGLYNKCGIYLRKDGVVVLQLRGTINKMESWLENFYAGMVPATGSLQLSNDYTFVYKLADNPQATVHVGWLTGVGFLMKEVLPTLDSLVQAGHHNLMIAGHSQGGALSFLTTSFLHYHYAAMQQEVRLKTYASAAPKPGNQYYAYDFDFISRGQMGFRVINDADWVPETPVSLQTIKDYNTVNPLSNAKSAIRKQKFVVRLFLNSVYGKLTRSSNKASRQFEKYLGKKLYKIAAKPLPGFAAPTLAGTMNYATAGSPVILAANDAYRSKFVFDGKNYFVHHMLAPYLFLLDAYYPLPTAK